MRIRCDATRPSNESTTFVILLRHYLHYNVNQHFQGRALQEAEGSFLRPAFIINYNIVIICSTSATLRPVSTRTDAAFSYSGPRIWNLLPYKLRCLTELTAFKNGLKTYLFFLAFEGIY